MIPTQRDSAQGGVLHRDNLAEQDFVASAARFLERSAATAEPGRGVEIDRGQRVSAPTPNFEGLTRTSPLPSNVSITRVEEREYKWRTILRSQYRKKKVQHLSASAPSFGASRTPNNSTPKQTKTVLAFMGNSGFKRNIEC